MAITPMHLDGNDRPDAGQAPGSGSTRAHRRQQIAELAKARVKSDDVRRVIERVLGVSGEP